MPQQPIQCHLALTSSDFILGNHHVHGVSVLPGVTFLDVLCRILVARGLDADRAVVRRLLFSEAIATSDELGREVRVTVDSGRDGVRQVRADGRGVRGGQPCSPWRPNFTADLTFSADPPPAAIDVAALVAGAVERRDMRDMYAQARAEQIEHGPPMTCHGTLHIGQTYLLGELDLDATAQPDAERFHLHPAVLDAATLVAFARTPLLGEPYIPVFLDTFRAYRPLRGRCYVYVPAREAMAASGDVLHNDFLLCDGYGEVVARFSKLSCQRIRYPRLITRLLEPAAESPSTVARPNGRAPADLAGRL